VEKRTAEPQNVELRMYTREGSKASFSRGDAEDAESYAKGFFRDLPVRQK